MPPTSSRVSVSAIMENLLKRKWSMPILGYLEKGFTSSAIVLKEPGLSSHVLSERLRSMLRYRIIARYPHPSPSTVIDYRLTPLGKKVWELLTTIEELDEKYAQRKHPELNQEPESDQPGRTVDLKSDTHAMTEATG